MLEIPLFTTIFNASNPLCAICHTSGEEEGKLPQLTCDPFENCYINHNPFGTQTEHTKHGEFFSPKKIHKNFSIKNRDNLKQINISRHFFRGLFAKNFQIARLNEFFKRFSFNLFFSKKKHYLLCIFEIPSLFNRKQPKKKVIIDFRCFFAFFSHTSFHLLLTVLYCQQKLRSFSKIEQTKQKIASIFHNVCPLIAAQYAKIICHRHSSMCACDATFDNARR